MIEVSTKAAERELTDPQAFAAAVKARRKAIGMTQVELANILGVTQPAITFWEGGEIIPELNTLFRLENALQLPRFALIKATEKKY